MNNKKFHAIAAGVLALVWVVLTGMVWFTPDREVSTSERRPLDQMPAYSQEAFLDGSFQKDFEAYLKDQFPQRDTFRQLKGALYTFLLNQKTDSNGMFYMDGHLSQHNVAFNAEAFQQRMDALNRVYEKYLKEANANVYVSVVPDKNYYLISEDENYLSLDYNKLVTDITHNPAAVRIAAGLYCISTIEKQLCGQTNQADHSPHDTDDTEHDAGGGHAGLVTISHSLGTADCRQNQTDKRNNTKEADEHTYQRHNKSRNTQAIRFHVRYLLSADFITLYLVLRYLSISPSHPNKNLIPSASGRGSEADM